MVSARVNKMPSVFGVSLHLRTETKTWPVFTLQEYSLQLRPWSNLTHDRLWGNEVSKLNYHPVTWRHFGGLSCMRQSDGLFGPRRHCGTRSKGCYSPRSVVSESKVGTSTSRRDSVGFWTQLDSGGWLHCSGVYVWRLMPILPWCKTRIAKLSDGGQGLGTGVLRKWVLLLRHGLFYKFDRVAIIAKRTDTGKYSIIPRSVRSAFCSATLYA